MFTHPNYSGCIYTIPHLDTVAGEAYVRSYTSKSMLILSLIGIVSPLMRHNFLLSSRTVFIFSIHPASTGPSNTINYLSLDYDVAHLRYISPKIPSVHSLDTGSEYPYN